MVTVLLLSCQTNKTPFQLKDIFYRNKNNLDKLVIDLRNIDGIDSLIIRDSTIFKISERFLK